MGTETTRLLIVLDQADYRTQVADIFDPQTLSEKLAHRVSAMDLNVLMMGGSLNAENVGGKICRDSLRMIADFCPNRIVLCSLAGDFSGCATAPFLQVATQSYRLPDSSLK